MTTTDDLLRNAEDYARDFDKGHLQVRPVRKVAVVACMDSRLNPYALFGLAEGDAHMIRNAGGVVTDDVLRSLVISQRLLDTREIILVHHTGCGMLTFTHDDFARQLEKETGLRPNWSAETFDDLDTDVRQSIKRIQADPFLPVKDAVRGFVYEVETGLLREVTP
jgi:carbonic anhydrase